MVAYILNSIKLREANVVGFEDNADSGFPSILATWKEEGWIKPELIEDTSLNQVTLYLRMIPAPGEQSAGKLSEKLAESAEMQEILLSQRQKQILECMELEYYIRQRRLLKK